MMVLTRGKLKSGWPLRLDPVAAISPLAHDRKFEHTAYVEESATLHARKMYEPWDWWGITIILSTYFATIAMPLTRSGNQIRLC